MGLNSASSTVTEFLLGNWAVGGGVRNNPTRVLPENLWGIDEH